MEQYKTLKPAIEFNKDGDSSFCVCGIVNPNNCNIMYLSIPEVVLPPVPNLLPLPPPPAFVLGEVHADKVFVQEPLEGADSHQLCR